MHCPMRDSHGRGKCMVANEEARVEGSGICTQRTGKAASWEAPLDMRMSLFQVTACASFHVHRFCNLILRVWSDFPCFQVLLCTQTNKSIQWNTIFLESFCNWSTVCKKYSANTVCNLIKKLNIHFCLYLCPSLCPVSLQRSQLHLQGRMWAPFHPQGQSFSAICTSSNNSSRTCLKQQYVISRQEFLKRQF